MQIKLHSFSSNSNAFSCKQQVVWGNKIFQTIIQDIFVFILVCLEDNESATKQQRLDPVYSHFGNVSYLNSQLFWICFYSEDEIFNGFYDKLLFSSSL